MAKNKHGHGRNATITKHLCEHIGEPLYANGLCGKCYHTKYMREHYHKNRKPEMYYFKQRMDVKFGISIGEYEELLRTQCGVCKICGRLPGSRRLAVDHSHRTGKLRGLLCGPCNTLLSHVEHDSAFSKVALRYLAEHENNS